MKTRFLILWVFAMLSISNVHAQTLAKEFSGMACMGDATIWIKDPGVKSQKVPTQTQAYALVRERLGEIFVYVAAPYWKHYSFWERAGEVIKNDILLGGDLIPLPFLVPPDHLEWNILGFRVPANQTLPAQAVPSLAWRDGPSAMTLPYLTHQSVEQAFVWPLRWISSQLPGLPPHLKMVVSVAKEDPEILEIELKMHGQKYLTAQFSSNGSRCRFR